MDARGSITSGLTNAVSNAIYGTKPLKSVGDAFLRGVGAGAATAGINYISDLIGQKPGWEGIDAGLLTGMAGKLISPYGGALRNPRRGCGSASPFVSGLGYGSSKGYKYDVPKAGSAGRKEKKKFSLKEFLKETAVGGITGGVASAGFYGAGKGIERLKDSFQLGYYHAIQEHWIMDLLKIYQISLMWMFMRHQIICGQVQKENILLRE